MDPHQHPPGEQITGEHVTGEHVTGDDPPAWPVPLGTVETEDNTWMLAARCRGYAPGEFFPSDGTGVEQAQRICKDCSVRVECLEYALLQRIDHGVWGGCSERERRRILKRRRDAASATAPQR